MQLKLTSTLTSRMLLLLFILISGTAILNAQQDIPKDLYMEIACFKYKKAGAVEYFKTTGNKINKELIRMGVIEDWKFFTVDFPNGSNCDCNLRAVRVFKGMSSLDKLRDLEIREKAIKNIWPDKDLDDVRAEFNEYNEFKGSEVFRLLDAVIPGPTDSNLSFVNFFKVKQGAWKEYERMETEVFKPLHVDMQKNGIMVDWFLAEQVFPYGADIPYNYITVDKFDSYEKVNEMSFGKSFDRIHNAMDIKSTMKQMNELRSLHKTEIWRRVDME